MTIRVLCVGDLVGAAGRAMFEKHIRPLKASHKIDAVIVNGENSSNQGRGITPKIAEFLKNNGADVITTGNHIWYRREAYNLLDEDHTILRPANFPSGAPGVGVTIVPVKNTKLAVINLQGRVFMRENLDCPLRTADSILSYLQDKTKNIIVDYHAEATSEKMALAFYLAGRVSGVVGTHTHIQTADDRVLPGDTAYITDLGMGGALNSMLGMQKDAIIKHFLTQLPVKFIVDINPPFVLSGAIIEIDTDSGAATSIERIRIIDDVLQVTESSD